MSQPYCVIKNGCCEWVMDPLPIVYGPFDLLEAEKVCIQLSERYGDQNWRFVVKPLVGVPSSDMQPKLIECKVDPFMRDKPA